MLRKIHKLGLYALVFLSVFLLTGATAYAGSDLTPPRPEKAPRLDEVCTNLQPMLTWVNSEGGAPPRTYVLQLDTSSSFDSQELMEIPGIPEDAYVTVKRPEKPLRDNTQWFWRVKAVDSAGKESSWSTELGGITARFFLNTSWNDRFAYVRVPARRIIASMGYGVENIQDYDDGNQTHWKGASNHLSHWVQFDLGEPRPISRIWLVCGMAGWKFRLPESVGWNSKKNLDGRLINYLWQYSNDGEKWIDIPETERSMADAYRTVFEMDNKPVTARYFRLFIKKWYGSAPKVYEATFYREGQPSVPEVPNANYVLVISTVTGFQSEPGIVKTYFGKMIVGSSVSSDNYLGFLSAQVPPRWELKVVEVPAHAFSVEVLKQMNPKPIAIFLTGSPNWFCQIPHFEFNGMFELVKTTDIPTYGACAGMQLMMMGYGHTFARHTGRSYKTSDLKDILEKDVPPIYIQKNDSIFAGMDNPFYGPEFHSWTVEVVEDDWEVLATSMDSKGFICNQVIRAINRPVYGVQFHAEIPKPFNCAKGILMNFLSMAVERAKDQGLWMEQ